MIQPSRVGSLNRRPVAAQGRYVLYWMQQAQRATCNHALEYAARQATALRLPLLSCFGVADAFPQANLRHYAFMLEGLRETQAALRQRGIPLVIRHQSPPELAGELGKSAALVVTDGGYLRVQKSWRQAAAAALPCSLVQVETDVLVPVTVASDHEEYTAATLRPKLHRLLPDYLRPLAEVGLDPLLQARAPRLPGLEGEAIAALAAALPLDRRIGPVGACRGGHPAAQARLEQFLAGRLAHYAERRSEPGSAFSSDLSPYLHFGQIAPLEIALAVQAWQGTRGTPALAVQKAAFMEELVVRRELSMNFVHYNAAYDRYDGLPAWARTTLARHAADPRPYTYTAERLEQADTHDPYWNAAQQEMVNRGKMHNYMRMYWGKKILEWSATPEAAFATALELNNRYELDGRDANAFAGVAWCFGKHDRPWGERPVFGNVRYMNAAGLCRKFDMNVYLAQCAGLTCGSAGSPPGSGCRRSRRR